MESGLKLPPIYLLTPEAGISLKVILNTVYSNAPHRGFFEKNFLCT